MKEFLKETWAWIQFLAMGATIVFLMFCYWLWCWIRGVDPDSDG